MWVAYARTVLAEAMTRLREIYAGAVGFDFDHVHGAAGARAAAPHPAPPCKHWA